MQVIYKRLKPRYSFKGKLAFLATAKIILEDFIILMVWLSLLYKQNIFSLVMFIVIVIYTYHRSNSSMTMIRSTIVIIMILEYYLALVNLSSYNSPK